MEQALVLAFSNFSLWHIDHQESRFFTWKGKKAKAGKRKKTEYLILKKSENERAEREREGERYHCAATARTETKRERETKRDEGKRHGVDRERERVRARRLPNGENEPRLYSPGTHVWLELPDRSRHRKYVPLRFNWFGAYLRPELQSKDRLRSKRGKNRSLRSLVSPFF